MKLTKKEEALLSLWAGITTEYIADERSTSASCAALGEYVRRGLRDYGEEYEKEFMEAFGERTNAAITRLLEELKATAESKIH